MRKKKAIFTDLQYIELARSIFLCYELDLDNAAHAWSRLFNITSDFSELIHYPEHTASCDGFGWCCSIMNDPDACNKNHEVVKRILEEVRK